MSRARAMLATIGIDVVIGYAVFLVLALFAGLVAGDGAAGGNATLADLLSGDAAAIALGDTGGRGVILVLLASATVLVPFFWRHRLAPLAYVVPLLVTLAAFWPLYVQHRRQREAVQAMGELGQALGDLAQQMDADIASPLANLETSAWVLVVVILYLAFRGVARSLAGHTSS